MNDLSFAPLVPWPILGLLIALSLVLALWLGRPWRALAALFIGACLANPTLTQETRAPLSDIVIIIEDETASQSLGGRTEQSNSANADLTRALSALDNVEVRQVTVSDDAADPRSRIVTALSDALAQAPSERVAGVFVISDGRAHDTERLDQIPDVPAPVHLLLSGEPQDWDRRLSLTTAPSYAVVGEETVLRFRIDDLGAAPGPSADVTLQIEVNGEAPLTFQVSPDQEIALPLTIPSPGANSLRLSTPPAPGELTDRNNQALVQINGIRDRLSVLLVTGTPHSGTRAWRSLLKSDPSVDLLHFTILRPPGKRDGVPSNELALIPFPTRELFMEKIDDFDLIIFDNYQRRGILPAAYLANVADYLRRGGAVLVAAGPEFAGVDSLARTPLGDALPARPTGQLIEQRFIPQRTDAGARHPVTAPLQGAPWGPWYRQSDIAITSTSAQTLMSGRGGRPLLILDRVGAGRAALLGSDQAWLWAQEGPASGPQTELFRRTAHWLMGEPELEEEALSGTLQNGALVIRRRTLDDAAPSVTVRAPDGATRDVVLSRIAQGVFEATLAQSELVQGLYTLEDDPLRSTIRVGPASLQEYQDPIASAAPLAPAVTGAVWGLNAGFPRIRTVSSGRWSGPGWLGIAPRAAYEVTGRAQIRLLPAWLALVIGAALVVLAWLREGRLKAN